jgi:phospholipase A1
MEEDKLNLELTEVDIIKKMDSLPPFSIYKDNYFVSGVPLNRSNNRETADSKFQISLINIYLENSTKAHAMAC